jgi:hypothetical protein
MSKRPTPASALLPTARAAPNGPPALAVAPVPMAMATLNSVLVQPPPLLMPQNEAHVALAVGAVPNAALATTPAATAPTARLPMNFGLMTVRWAVGFPLFG